MSFFYNIGKLLSFPFDLFHIHTFALHTIRSLKWGSSAESKQKWEENEKKIIYFCLYNSSPCLILRLKIFSAAHQVERVREECSKNTYKCVIIIVLKILWAFKWNISFTNRLLLSSKNNISTCSSATRCERTPNTHQLHRKKKVYRTHNYH